MDSLLKKSEVLRELFLTGECIIRSRDDETLDHLIANMIFRGINYRVTEINTSPDFYTKADNKKIELINKQKGIEAYEHMEKHKFGEAGLGDIQVGYIFEKKIGSDAGSRFMVVAVQRYESPSMNMIVATLSSGDKLNVNEYENATYKYVGRLSFEGIPS